MVWVLLSKDHGKTNHVTRNVTHGKMPSMVIFIRDTCMKSKKLKKQSKERLKNITRQKDNPQNRRKYLQMKQQTN